MNNKGFVQRIGSLWLLSRRMDLACDVWSDRFGRWVSGWWIPLQVRFVKARLKTRMLFAAWENQKELTVVCLNSYGHSIRGALPAEERTDISLSLQPGLRHLTQDEQYSTRLLTHPAYLDLWRHVESLGLNPRLSDSLGVRGIAYPMVVMGYEIVVKVESAIGK